MARFLSELLTSQKGISSPRSNRRPLLWSSKLSCPSVAVRTDASTHSSGVFSIGAHFEHPKCAVQNASNPSESLCSRMVGLMQACRWEYLRVGMNTCFSCIGPTAYGCCLCPSRSNFKHPNYNATRTVSVRMDSSEVYAIKEECWACGKIKSGKNFLMCPFCNVVQPPNSDITYFDIFDQEQRFDIDLKDLEAKYKSLMKTLHPDLTHGKSVQEKEYYAQWSALVTTAYTDLLKPVSRATYLLKLRGIHVEEEGTVTDPDLIMEVMDFREALQSMPDRKTLEELNKKASGRMDDWRAAFKAAFEEGNNTAAVGALQRMSYFGRVCEDINRELL